MHTTSRSTVTAGASVLALWLAGGSACSGPQPLELAIAPTDEQWYQERVTVAAVAPRQAWYAWAAAHDRATVETVAQADAALSATRNPFERTDTEAVSRGAVIYKHNCMSCHGQRVDGRGPELPPGQRLQDFHSFSNRFASTLHGGAPSRWFRVISEGAPVAGTGAGVGGGAAGVAGVDVAMPAFEGALARAQIWQVITYLQSLDVHRRPAARTAAR